MGNCKAVRAELAAVNPEYAAVKKTIGLYPVAPVDEKVSGL